MATIGFIDLCGETDREILATAASSMHTTPQNRTSTRPRWSRGELLLLGGLVCIDIFLQFMLAFADPPPPELDALRYWQLAGQFVDGDLLQQQEAIAFRPPGHPTFLALFRFAFGSWALQAAIWAQHLLVVGTSVMTAVACRRLTGRASAAVAAYLLSMLCYSRAWHANVLLAETLFTFILAIVLLRMIRYQEQPSPLHAAQLGLVNGCLTLVRPIATYLWVPLLVFFYFASRGRGLRARLIDGLLLVAVNFAILAPWYARNAYVFGEPFLTKFVGRNLWIVTFQGGSGAGLPMTNGPATQELRSILGDRIDSVDLVYTWSVALALRDIGIPDDDIDRLMLRVCRESIAQDWSRMAYYGIRRTVNFWRCVSNPLPFADTESDDERYAGQQIWRTSGVRSRVEWLSDRAVSRSLRMNELVIFLVVLCGIGLLARPPTRPLAVGFLLVLLYFNAVTAAVEIPHFRYRMILEPTMILIFVCGLWSRALPTAER